MQQFHLKVKSRYYNRIHCKYPSLSIYTSVSLTHKHSFSAAYKIQTRRYSFYACHLQDSGMREENMHDLRRKAPSLRLLRELHLEEFKRSAFHWPDGSFALWAHFVCCKLSFFFFFFKSWAAPLFSGTRLSCVKYRKTCVLMHRCTNTDVCTNVKCVCAHTYTALFKGGIFKPFLAPDQTKFPMKFSLEQMWI